MMYRQPKPKGRKAARNAFLLEQQERTGRMIARVYKDFGISKNQSQPQSTTEKDRS